jgi:hypothetical protein
VAELFEGEPGLLPPDILQKIEKIIYTMSNLCIGFLTAPLLAHKFGSSWKNMEVYSLLGPKLQLQLLDRFLKYKKISTRG